jgi:hypothetical protein
MALTYSRLAGNRGTWIEWDADDPSVNPRFIIRADIISRIQSNQEALTLLPEPKTNAQLIAWARANYPGSAQAMEAQRLVEQIAADQALLALLRES